MVFAGAAVALAAIAIERLLGPWTPVGVAALVLAAYQLGRRRERRFQAGLGFHEDMPW